MNRQTLINRAMTVSKVTSYIKSVFDDDVILSDALIVGEISDLKYHSSGHVYFTLKDKSAGLSAVMWKSDAQLMPFMLENGMAAVVYGRVSVYEKTGRYQLYAEFAEPVGEGDMKSGLDKLKERLTAEGLFKPENKKPLPETVAAVAVVTSLTGAAVRDVINVAGRRSPSVLLIVVPATVQGDGAAKSISDAIRLADRSGKADAIIIGRGGGSSDDLSAFNAEAVVRAVADCKTTTISAVGHETDWTLTDFAADLRAPTPSAAAELAVADETASKRRFVSLVRYIDGIIDERVQSTRDRAEHAETTLNREIEREIRRKSDRLNALTSLVDSLSPMKVLSRGYAAASIGGTAIKGVKDINVGDAVTLTFADGTADAEINKKTDK